MDRKDFLYDIAYRLYCVRYCRASCLQEEVARFAGFLAGIGPTADLKDLDGGTLKLLITEGDQLAAKMKANNARFNGFLDGIRSLPASAAECSVLQLLADNAASQITRRDAE